MVKVCQMINAVGFIYGIFFNCRILQQIRIGMAT